MGDSSYNRVRAIEFQLKKQRIRFAIKCLNKVMQNNPNINLVINPSCIYEALLLLIMAITDPIRVRLYQTLISMDTTIEKFTYIRKKKYAENILVYYPTHENCYHDVRLWTKHKVEFQQTDLIIQLFHGPYMQLNPSWSFRINMNQVNKFLREIIEKLQSMYPVQLPVEISNKKLKKKEKEETDHFILATSVSCKFSKSWNKDEAATSSTSNRDKIINYFDKGLKIHVTDISYQDDKMSLLIISPAALINDIWQIKSKIQNSDLLELTERLLEDNNFHVFCLLLRNSRSLNSDRISSTSSVFPNFEVEKDLNMGQLLRSLDFELLRTDKYEIFLSEQRKGAANIQYAVHRSGVKATKNELVVGATTVIHSVAGYEPVFKKVNVDKTEPFVWLIYDREQDAILSIGSCNNAELNCDIKLPDVNIDQPCPDISLLRTRRKPESLWKSFKKVK